MIRTFGLTLVALSAAMTPLAHADFWKWAGDRTGLGRPISELSGQAERQRTNAAREEARQAESEMQAASADLEQKRRDLEIAQARLEDLKQQARDARARLRQSLLPILGQLGSLTAQALFLRETTADLLKINGDLQTVILKFRDSFASVSRSSQGFKLEASAQDKISIAVNYLSKVTTVDETTHKETHELVTKAKEWSAYVDSTYTWFLDQLLPARSQSMHQQLSKLGEAMTQTVNNINQLATSAQAVNSKGGL